MNQVTSVYFRICIANAAKHGTARHCGFTMITFVACTLRSAGEQEPYRTCAFKFLQALTEPKRSLQEKDVQTKISSQETSTKTSSQESSIKTPSLVSGSQKENEPL